MAEVKIFDVSMHVASFLNSRKKIGIKVNFEGEFDRVIEGERVLLMNDIPAFYIVGCKMVQWLILDWEFDCIGHDLGRDLLQKELNERTESYRWSTISVAEGLQAMASLGRAGVKAADAAKVMNESIASLGRVNANTSDMFASKALSKAFK